MFATFERKWTSWKNHSLPVGIIAPDRPRFRRGRDGGPSQILSERSGRARQPPLPGRRPRPAADARLSLRLLALPLQLSPQVPHFVGQFRERSDVPHYFLLPRGHLLDHRLVGHGDDGVLDRLHGVAVLVDFLEDGPHGVGEEGLPPEDNLAPDELRQQHLHVKTQGDEHREPLEVGRVLDRLDVVDGEADEEVHDDDGHHDNEDEEEGE